MKIVLLSDTHCFEPEIREDGDVLVHSGDFMLAGCQKEAEKAAKWFAEASKRFAHAVCVAGNHDWFFHDLGFQGTQDFFARHGNNIQYLLDSSINIDGVNFYGSPWQPTFFNWAFNVPRGEAIRKYWNMIPDAGLVDVLITHGPPRGVLDQAAPHKHSECLGCDDLFEAVERSEPKIHVFGHIHGGYGRVRFGEGSQFFNASICDEAYRPVNNPWVATI